MTYSAFSWSYEGPYHTAFLATTTSLSFFSNGVLLYIIYSTSSKSIGPYKHLLAAFAVSDMMTSTGHAAFQPYLHMTSDGFYFFPRHGKMVIGRHSYDTMLAVIFLFTYYQSFLVLAYHYFYRYKSVVRGITTSFTDFWRSPAWTGVALCVYIAYMTAFMGACGYAFTPNHDTRELMPQEISALYGINLHNHQRGFVVIAIRRPDSTNEEMVWHVPSMIGLGVLLGLFAATAFVMVYYLWKTKRFMRSSNNQLPEKTRKVQKEFFKALLIQSAIPVLFGYLPFLTILISPAITSISLGDFGNVLFNATAIFPSINAFFVIFGIERYKIAFIRLFRIPFTAHSRSTTTVQPIDVSNGVVGATEPVVVLQ